MSSPAQNRVDAVKSDVQDLEACLAVQRDRAELAEKNLRAAQANDNSQRALLVYRDGRIDNRPLSVQPSSNLALNYEPVRYMEVLDAPLHPVYDHVYYSPQASPVTTRRFQRVHDQARDAKLVIYTER